MSTTTGSEVSLDAVEIDLLCTFAEVAPPFPLRIRQVGATSAERRAIFTGARDRLARRGLAGDRGPLGAAATFVHLLRDSVTALDLLLAVGTDLLGAVVLAAAGEGLLAVQELGEVGGPVTMVALPVDDAVDELLELVPDLDAAMTTPLTLPRRALDGVHRAMAVRTASDPMSADEVDRLLAAHGIDDQLARRIATHLQPVLGNGQAGLAARRGHAGAWQRMGAELRWLDTEAGRFRLAGGEDGSDEWISVNPFFQHELYAAVRGLAGLLRS